MWFHVPRFPRTLGPNRSARSSDRAALLTTLLLPLLLGGCAGLGGPSWSQDSRSFFEAEVLTGVGEDGQSVATLSVTIPFRNLVFFREAEGYVSTYRIRAVQRDRRGRQRLRQWTGRTRVATYEETRASQVARSTFSLDLAELVGVDTEEPPVLEVIVEIDGTTRRGRRELALRPQEFEEGELSVAELALYRQRDAFESVPTSLEVMGRALPDPDLFRRQADRRFDVATGEPWLFVRLFDLRGEVSEDTLRMQVTARLVDASSPTWSTEVEAQRQGTVTSVLLRLPRSAFRYGAHRLTVELEGGGSQEIILHDLGLDLQQARSWKSNLASLRVIATEEEMQELERAPVDEREQRWREFWRRRDPNPRTPENERLEEHFRRVGYARTHLKDGFDDGARSDRGEVYIRHGEPDSVERGAPSLDTFTEYEVWRYLQDGITYYFRDTSGAGHFRLVWWEEE